MDKLKNKSIFHTIEQHIPEAIINQRLHFLKLMKEFNNNSDAKDNMIEKMANLKNLIHLDREFLNAKKILSKLNFKDYLGKIDFKQDDSLSKNLGILELNNIINNSNNHHLKYELGKINKNKLKLPLIQKSNKKNLVQSKSQTSLSIKVKQNVNEQKNKAENVCFDNIRNKNQVLFEKKLEFAKLQNLKIRKNKFKLMKIEDENSNSKLNGSDEEVSYFDNNFKINQKYEESELNKVQKSNSKIHLKKGKFNRSVIKLESLLPNSINESKYEVNYDINGSMILNKQKAFQPILNQIKSNNSSFLDENKEYNLKEKKTGKNKSAQDIKPDDSIVRKWKAENKKNFKETFEKEILRLSQIRNNIRSTFNSELKEIYDHEIE